MVDSIGDLILIFGLNLSIGSPYYQGGRIWMNFRLSKCFMMRWYSWESHTSLTKHSAQSFCTESDDPAKQWISALSKSGWSGLSPDDPDLVTCERLEEGQAGWSGPTPDDPDLGISSVFSLFCSYPRWSEVTPDDPGTTRKYTTVTFGGWSIYTPSFTSLSLPDQLRLQSIHSFTSLHPRAWFLQGNT